MSMNKADRRVFVWLLAALCPVLLMAVSFVFDHWTWGLMDDPKMLIWFPGSWPERIGKLMADQWSHGTLRWTNAALIAVCYDVFRDAPKAFYFFRMFFLVGGLLIWGWSAALLTRRRLALVLVPAAAFSFYFLYDAFFYLSVHEPAGIFFAGLALLFLIKGAIRPGADNRPLCLWKIGLGLLAVVLSVMSKEMFVSVPLAFGGGLLCAAFLYRRKGLLLTGAGLLLAGIAYALFLKFVLQRGYTSSYDMTDMGRLGWNLWTWLRHSAVFHLPWLLMTGYVIVQRFRRRDRLVGSREEVFGIVTAFLVYGSFLLLILPWQTVNFYVSPLGLFFAFGVAVFLAGYLAECRPLVSRVLLIVILGFNIAVCWHSFGTMAVYRNDTAQLLDWMEYNQQFLADVASGAEVATNSQEAGDTIPMLLKHETGINVPHFRHIYRVKEILLERRLIYYLYNPAMGDQDLRRVKQIWSVAFSSRSWVLFRRQAWINL